MPKSKSNLKVAFEKVNKIDLTPISQLLQDVDPTQWTVDTLADAESNYRKFLVLNLLYPDETIVVNKIIDDYWHQHILDTRKYAEDCQMFFGYFLHHYPYFGNNGAEDKQNNLDGFAMTQQLWEEAFGVPMVKVATLSLDNILGMYDPNPKDSDKNRVYAFPQSCKNGQHCNRSIIPDPRINPMINPKINPQINPQIRIPIVPNQRG